MLNYILREDASPVVLPGHCVSLPDITCPRAAVGGSAGVLIVLDTESVWALMCFQCCSLLMSPAVCLSCCGVGGGGPSVPGSAALCRAVYISDTFSAEFLLWVVLLAGCWGLFHPCSCRKRLGTLRDVCSLKYHQLPLLWSRLVHVPSVLMFRR